MIRIICEINPQTNAVGFDARHANGQKLSKLELAYFLSKIQAALISEAIVEKGNNGLIVNPSAAFTTRVLNS